MNKDQLKELFKNCLYYGYFYKWIIKNYNLTDDEETKKIYNEALEEMETF